MPEKKRRRSPFKRIRKETLLTMYRQGRPFNHAQPARVMFLTLLFISAFLSTGAAGEYPNADAAFAAYCTIYEKNDPSSLDVYAEEGVIRFLDQKSGKSKAIPMGMYKNLILAMIPSAKIKGEYVVFSPQPERAQTGNFYTWRGRRTTYPGASTMSYIVDICKDTNTTYRVVREVLLTSEVSSTLH
jgi:hypothetical protein